MSTPKLFLLLSRSGRPRSPDLLTEGEVLALRQDVDFDFDVFEVTAPWDRPAPISKGGRGGSIFQLEDGEDVTHLRVPRGLLEGTKSYAVWLSEQRRYM